MFTMSGDETAGAILVLVTVKASIVHKQLRTKPFGPQVHLFIKFTWRKKWVGVFAVCSV